MKVSNKKHLEVRQSAWLLWPKIVSEGADSDILYIGYFWSGIFWIPSPLRHELRLVPKNIPLIRNYYGHLIVANAIAIAGAFPLGLSLRWTFYDSYSDDTIRVLMIVGLAFSAFAALLGRDITRLIRVMIGNYNEFLLAETDLLSQAEK